MNLRALRKVFCQYIEVVRSVLEKPVKPAKKNVPLRLIFDRGETLGNAIRSLEERPEFLSLVEETISVFSKIPSKEEDSKWVASIKNFFRRSGYYIDVFQGKPCDNDKTFAEYCNAFEEKKKRETERDVVYLAPMSYVSFSEETMNFDDFVIRRFSKDELRHLFLDQNRINQVFYPSGIIDIDKAIDEKFLDRYWFIEFKDTERLLPEGHNPWDEIGLHTIDTKYPELEPILEQLVLFDWPIQGVYRSLGFNIPFLLKNRVNFLDHPSLGPSFSELETLELEERFGPSGEEFLDVAIDANLNPNETHLFRNHLACIERKLSNIRTHKGTWYFFGIALNFLIKAFFSEGVEQMLWHVFTLEALVVEKPKDITEQLKKRLSAIWGDNEIGNKFKKIYDFRCNIVHGKKEMKNTKIYDEHLYQARVLARGTSYWFLCYLNYMLSSSQAPSRSNLLKLIDNELDKNFLKDLRGRLPQEFPNIPAWLGQIS